MKLSMQHVVTSTTAAAVLLFASVTSAGEKKDIIDTAVGAGSFKTLAAALGAADLVGALKGDGPFTVFAPTDEAFAKLPEGTVETLLKPENKEKLIAILTYHVVSGEVPAKKVVGLKAAETLNGQSVAIAVNDGTVKIDRANVVKTDIRCSNGIIHVIDSVLLPSEKKVGGVEAREKIKHAVARGSRTFNAGHHANCADIYTSVMRELVGYADQMPEDVVSRMKQVLHKAENIHNPTHRAWALRHGLDHVYARMSELP